MTVDRALLSQRADNPDGGIPVALSSDDPCDMGYGTEVLEHSTDAIDLSRAADGLPMLADHDRTQLIGRLRDLTIGDDGKLRAVAYPASSAKAQEVFTDMQNGMRPDMSIGYRVLAWEEPSKDNGNMWVITRWMPYEASSVAIPADITVGVGREAPRDAASEQPTPATEDRTMPEPTVPVAPAPSAGAAPAVQDPTPIRAASAIRAERDAEISEIVALAGQHNRLADLPSYLSRGLSRDQVANEILSKQREANVPIAAPAGHVDLSAKDRKAYSVVRAINHQIASMTGSRGPDAGLELEVSQTIARGLNRSPTGFFMPMNLGAPQTRASLTGQTAATAGDGGDLVQTDVGTVIDLLRNRMVCQRAGATIMPGLTDSISFPRQITANTFTWTGENPSTPATPTKLTFDVVTLSPKQAQAVNAFSRRLLVQSSVDIESFVRSDLATIAAIGLDLAGLAGLGSSNQPTGITHTSGVNSVVTAADAGNGGKLAYADILSFISQVEVGNADLGALSFVFTPEIKADLKSTAKIGSTYPIFLMDDQGEVEGYPTFITNQLPKTLTKGSANNCHAAIFGNFNDLVIGEFGGALDILVDPFTYSSQGMIATNVFLLADIAVRHAASFSVALDVLV